MMKEFFINAVSYASVAALLVFMVYSCVELARMERELEKVK